ncbi:MAG: hypothetical protein WBA97_31795 [Actinophytocola sp.]|uniref:hypothetical protein n=1 Tax=Actinophytocola sp. TaxID=1872138 RepID=UPI003C775A69
MLIDLARQTDRREYSGPSPEQVTVISHLLVVKQQLDELCLDVMTSGNGPWLSVADMLEASADQCRNIDRFTLETRLLQERREAPPPSQ